MLFELRQSSFGPYTRFDLFHETSESGFSIVPECGATVLNIRFQGKNILDGYNTPEELEAAKWGKSAVLFPFPNRLDGGRYTWNGSTYTFPINNAATGNAIHGFARAHAFEVVQVQLEAARASLHCRFRYQGEHAYYPFPLELDLIFSIDLKGEFTLETRCKNLHSAAIPVGFGWHPYFKLDKNADVHRLQLPAAAMVAINERMIPTGSLEAYNAFEKRSRLGETFLDNCFKNTAPKGPYRLALAGRHGKISVKASAADMPYFQVFTPPHRESVALEPMSCNVNAFNNGDGLVRLESGKVWKAKMSIQYKR